MYRKRISARSYVPRSFGVCSVAFLSNLRKLASDEVYHLPLVDLTQLTQGLGNELRSWVRYVWHYVQSILLWDQFWPLHVENIPSFKKTWVVSCVCSVRAMARTGQWCTRLDGRQDAITSWNYSLKRSEINGLVNNAPLWQERTNVDPWFDWFPFLSLLSRALSLSLFLFF